MAERTIAGQLWPEGTIVSVYPANAWVDKARAPFGAPVTSPGVVSGGTVTFGGLIENVRYVAYGDGVGVAFMAVLDGLQGAVSKPDRERIKRLEDSAGSVTSRVLLWDEDAAQYSPADLLTDTSVPREFVGPVDPSLIGAIAGPVFGDRWTPTEAST